MRHYHLATEEWPCMCAKPDYAKDINHKPMKLGASQRPGTLTTDMKTYSAIARAWLLLACPASPNCSSCPPPAASPFSTSAESALVSRPHWLLADPTSKVVNAPIPTPFCRQCRKFACTPKQRLSSIIGSAQVKTKGSLPALLPQAFPCRQSCAHKGPRTMQSQS
jgi:hypothetical protein